MIPTEDNSLKQKQKIKQNLELKLFGFPPDNNTVNLNGFIMVLLSGSNMR